MYHSEFELLEGAFIIADAHYSHQRPQLLAFMKEINANKLQPTQIIFLGDCFDALFYEVKQTLENNKEIIEEIALASKRIEIIFFEGNHDFNLQRIFPKLKVYKLSQQPVVVNYRDKKVLLSHGDFDAGLLYRIYSAIIRNSIILKVLATIDSFSKNFILKGLDEKLSKKDDCKKMQDFYSYTQKRFENSSYICDYFIDGHYHQNKSYTYKDFHYINLGAFACNQRYFSVKFFKDKELLEEKFFLKG